MSEAMEVEQLKLPYSQDPTWTDVSPILLDDGNCVVAIQYTAEHKEALSYFRAVLSSGEKSQRALQLTEDMINFNQADYTAWQWRWLCIEALNSDLAAEQRLTHAVMQDNAKNYQLWNHRRKCALRAGPASAQDELDFSVLALNIDEKNYHAWAHRMALVQAFGGPLWLQELQFVENMISRDVRNNSAWNHRAFVVKALTEANMYPGTSGSVGGSSSSSPGGRQPGTSGSASSGSSQHQVLLAEVAYVEQQVLKAPRNESSWNYLVGLFPLLGCGPLEMARWPKVHAICMAALAQAPSCSTAMSVLAEYYTVVAKSALHHVARLTAAGVPSQAQVQAGTAALRAAVRNGSALLDGLTFADPIRTMYWVHRHQVLQSMLAWAGSDDMIQ